jgi:hypothetical protein
MINRRHFIQGCTCAVVGGPIALDASPAKKPIQGCLLMADPRSALNLSDRDFGSLAAEDTTSSTGDKALDRHLGKALVRMSRMFETVPSFAMYQDGASKNAYASSKTILPRTWGSVAFGKSLFQDQFERYNDGGISVIAIIAHEFAHVYQFRNRLMEPLQGSDDTVRRIELHADFLAGWYLGNLKKTNPKVSLWASGDTFRRIGDTNYTSPQHHGMPDERVAAAERGFSLGFRESVDIVTAVQHGRRHVGRG